jgi:hypothetical protein
MWIKSLVAVCLAFPAAVAVTGVVALLGPGSLENRTLPVLLMFFPLWVAAISVPFLCRTGLRAALLLGSVCVVGFGLLHAAKSLHWVVLPA